MKELYELREKLCDELKDYSKKDVSANSLDLVDKLAHTVKNLDKIIDKYADEGYSGRYSMYEPTRSYARKRDSMGRYSSRGYSYHDDMMGDLRKMMDDAPDEKTRNELRRFIDKMETM